MTSGRRVLVTGGAGFIGSHLVDALVARGDRVDVVDNLSVGSRANLAQHEGSGSVDLHVVDVVDGTRLIPLFSSVDTVFHLATQCVRVSLFDPELVHRVNSEGTLRVLMAAAAVGVRQFVYVSSSEAYGSARTAPMSEEHPCDPTTVYGASKLAGELYTRAFHRTHGLRTVVVRPFNTYGPRARFEGAYGELIPKCTVRVMNGLRPIVFGDGLQTRDFTHVSDTVRGIMLAADAETLNGSRVNIARGQEASVNDVARLVVEACGRPDLMPEHGPDRPADVRRHYADITRAQRELGFEPSVALPDGIRDYVAWFRKTYPDPTALLQHEQAYNWQPAARI
jgi:UDP-glucose 4-epimerase